MWHLRMWHPGEQRPWQLGLGEEWSLGLPRWQTDHLSRFYLGETQKRADPKGWDSKGQGW